MKAALKWWNDFAFDHFWAAMTITYSFAAGVFITFVWLVERA